MIRLPELWKRGPAWFLHSVRRSLTNYEETTDEIWNEPVALVR